MSSSKFPKSPVFPQAHRWTPITRKDGYESDATALIRALVSDESVREDQKTAWQRWRNDAKPLRQP